MDNTIIVNYEYEESGVYKIRVSKELWPAFKTVMMDAGEKNNYNVEFKSIKEI